MRRRVVIFSGENSMNLKLLAAAALLACASLAAETFSESDLETARELRAAALAGDGGVEIVADLATLIGPRIAGSDGEKRARGKAQKTLREPGTDPDWTETA